MSYTAGLQEVGDGLFAYLQPDGGWGWSNAGLITDGEATLLVDTLYDLALTERMLKSMRDAVPAAARIDTLVNTHANGDHCYGNQLVSGARIVASERTAAEMGELPPAAMAALIEQAPQMGELGAFFLECFGAFDFSGIELALPDETFSGRVEMSVGGRALELIEVGPAHTRGDTLVHVPAARVLFSGDILFSQAHLFELRGGPPGHDVRQPVADAVGEIARALLQERGDALDRVGRLPAEEHAARVGAVGEHRVLGAEHRPHHLPRQRDRHRRGVLGDLARQRARGVEQLCLAGAGCARDHLRAPPARRTPGRWRPTPSRG
jgi:glyoxylase-like metal-dependent hydrolase (beta-lactamase superfamily II)